MGWFTPERSDGAAAGGEGLAINQPRMGGSLFAQSLRRFLGIGLSFWNCLGFFGGLRVRFPPPPPTLFMV